MGEFLEVFFYVIIGAFLLWFGYTLFSKFSKPSLGWEESEKGKLGPQPEAEGVPGDPQICPVCSAKLEAGELVNSAAFPSLNGGQDRFMHIKGCLYCLVGERDRLCPVCGVTLVGDEILISRLFERPGRRSHVHVIGCSRCKGPRKYND